MMWLEFFTQLFRRSDERTPLNHDTVESGYRLNPGTPRGSYGLIPGTPTSIQGRTCQEAHGTARPRGRRASWGWSADANWKLLLTALVVAWLTTGTLFYHLHDELTFPQAFYYTAQAGLNVGFGVFPLPPDAWTVVVSCIMVMFGASFVSASLAIFIQGVLAEQEDISKQVMNFEDVDTDGSGELDYEEFRRFVLRNREWGFTSESIPDLFKEVDVDGSGTVNAQEFEAFIAKATGGDFPARVKMVLLQYGGSIKAFSALVVWVTGGVLFGLYWECWPFWTSLYYAVTALSTAGLQGPQKDTFSVLFTAVYILIGVPIFALCLAKVAGIIVNRYQDHRLKMKLSEKMGEADLQLAETLSSLGDLNGEVDKYEFLCLKLVKLGRLDVDLLGAIEKEFNTLDQQGVGHLSRGQLLQQRGLTTPTGGSPRRTGR